ncbi:TPA: hypothetical protein ACIJOS_001842 [Citrobacter koseri]
MLYNTGTIAINGNSATGTGTNWTAPASQIRVGQTIIVLSNPVQMFQITTINSATSLTVTPAASPALSGQKYGILVSDNLSVDGLAQSISQLINEYDENISAWEAFALTSANQAINVTINGTPVSIPALGKLVQKGVNGAVPVNQGGTGATTAEDARTNLGLRSAALADILGTVSQSGGVTTGAIIEKGSNSNGEYTKFADGTMICRRRITTAELNTNINVPNNLGGFRGGQVLIPFAATFVGLPVGSGDVQNNPDGARCNVTADTTTQWTVGIHTNNSGNVATTHAVNLLAIGRWF